MVPGTNTTVGAASCSASQMDSVMGARPDSIETSEYAGQVD